MLRASRLANKLVDIVCAEPGLSIMLAAHVDFGEDVFVSRMFVALVHIVHTAGNIEEGNHFVHILVDHQRMGFARRLKDVVAGPRNPIMLKIAPGALDHIAMDGRGMAVPAERPGPPHAQ